jgi:hypothetical protein
MPVKDADPKAAELDDAFRAAMNGPAKPREAGPPPEIDPDAPHGRDEAGEPLAPHGHNKDGSVRKSAAGRRAKDDQARTGTVIPPGEKPKGGRAMPEPADYTEALSDLGDAVWFGITGLSMVGPRIPLVGKFLSKDKLAAEAYVWQSNKPALVKAAQIGARHNVAIAIRCAKLSDGEMTWVLMAGACLMPFLAQTAAVFGGDEALAKMNPDASLERLAGLNKNLMDSAMEQLKQQLAEAAAAAADVGAEEPAAAASL